MAQQQRPALNNQPTKQAAAAAGRVCAKCPPETIGARVSIFGLPLAAEPAKRISCALEAPRSAGLLGGHPRCRLRYRRLRSAPGAPCTGAGNQSRRMSAALSLLAAQGAAAGGADGDGDGEEANGEDAGQRRRRRRNEQAPSSRQVAFVVGHDRIRLAEAAAAMGAAAMPWAKVSRALMIAASQGGALLMKHSTLRLFLSLQPHSQTLELGQSCGFAGSRARSQLERSLIMIARQRGRRLVA